MSISKRSLETTKRITTTETLACHVPYYVTRRVVTPRPVSIKRLGVSGPLKPELVLGAKSSGPSGVLAAPPQGLLVLAVHSGPWSLPLAAITCSNGDSSTSPIQGRNDVIHSSQPAVHVAEMAGGGLGPGTVPNRWLCAVAV